MERGEGERAILLCWCLLFLLVRGLRRVSSETLADMEDPIAT